MGGQIETWGLMQERMASLERQVSAWRFIAIVLFIGGTIQWVAHLIS